MCLLLASGLSGTDLWLWMSFLRTGRADVFRIAYAMTRHLSEVRLFALSLHNRAHGRKQVDFHHIVRPIIANLIMLADLVDETRVRLQV